MVGLSYRGSDVRITEGLSHTEGLTLGGKFGYFFTTVQQDIEAFGEPLLSEGISYRDFCPRLRNDFWEA